MSRVDGGEDGDWLASHAAEGAREIIHLAIEAFKKRDAAKVGSSADTGDDNIGIFTGHLHLFLAFLTDNCLVHQDMVENAAQRVMRILARGGIFDGFTDGQSQAAWAVGVCGQSGAS